MTVSASSGTPLNETDFLANVSHEIRNPLNAIIGITHLLEDNPSPQDSKEYIKALLQTSESLLGIVNNLMDFSKLESGKLDLEKRPVDLRRTIKHSIFGQKALARAKDIDLELMVDPNLPPLLLVDSVKLGQVMINLVSNAIKFTEEGSVKIHLELLQQDAEGAKVRFAVRDTGIGIPANKLENIFKAFDQGSGGINLNYGGTGLGLSISKSLVRMMGGELKVSSKEGQGAEFYFVLPLEVLRDPVLGEHPEDAVEASIKDLRVLLVDDNKLNRMVVQKNLERWGISCELAQNGQEALEEVQQQDFDVILMDLHMPVMNGFEAARAIKNLPGEKFRQLEIIALSAATDHLYQERIKAAGISDFINKPFKPKELLRKLTSYCRYCSPS